LWRRKPRQAPKTIAASTAAPIRPSDRSITQNVAPEIAQTPAASPSSPSRKLTMFITATIPTTVSGIPNHAGNSCTPTTGNVNVCTQMPKPTGIDAASTCPPASATS
jgi:hypothetical protein